MDAVLETILHNATWSKANYRSPADMIDKIDPDETKVLSNIANSDEKAKQIIHKFCSYLTNNPDSTPEIKVLFPPKLSTTADGKLISDSNSIDDFSKISLNSADEPNSQADHCPPPPCLTSIRVPDSGNKSSSDQDEFWSAPVYENILRI